MLKALTSDNNQGCEAGERGDVKLHAMEVLRKLQDGVDPVPKASDTLCFMKHSPVAEDELFRPRIGPLKQTKTLVVYSIECLSQLKFYKHRNTESQLCSYTLAF